MPTHTQHYIIRRTEVLKQYGISNTTLHNRIKSGLMPPSILLGVRSVGWIQYELDTVLAAMIAGRDNDHIRALIDHLIDERQKAA